MATTVRLNPRALAVWAQAALVTRGALTDDTTEAQMAATVLACWDELTDLDPNCEETAEQTLPRMLEQIKAVLDGTATFEVVGAQ